MNQLLGGSLCFVYGPTEYLYNSSIVQSRTACLSVVGELHMLNMLKPQWKSQLVNTLVGGYIKMFIQKF